ncbi:hypothetical protein [Paenibacillus mesotrionivorans]|jgi:hypothetical protein|uniref:Uncharacterized protein n=1 Tax=Paenibacillus mesotrionivorans TaxID=3160968 RepID=A0ACC7P1G3_9BACL
MAILLDQQVSQNASTANAIAIPLSATPALFGTLGLNVSGAGTNLRVHFTATVTAAALVAVLTPVTIDIFRVVGGVSTLIFSVTENLPVGTLVLSQTVVTANGIDYNPPNDGFIVYQAFVSAPGLLEVFPTRVGPESFNAEAYSD